MLRVNPEYTTSNNFCSKSDLFVRQAQSEQRINFGAGASESGHMAMCEVSFWSQEALFVDRVLEFMWVVTQLDGWPHLA